MGCAGSIIWCVGHVPAVTHHVYWKDSGTMRYNSFGTLDAAKPQWKMVKHHNSFICHGGKDSKLYEYNHMYEYETCWRNLKHWASKNGHLAGSHPQPEKESSSSWFDW